MTDRFCVAQAQNQDTTQHALETTERVNHIRPSPTRWEDNLTKFETYPLVVVASKDSGEAVEDLNFFFRRGIALEESGRLDKADEAYRKALILAQNDEDKVKGYRAIAEVAKKRAKWDEARDSFLSALKLDPKNTEIMRALGNLAYVRKDYNETARWFRRSLELNPNRRDREFLANVLYLTKDYRAAVKELNQVLKGVDSQEDRYRAYMALGHSHFGLEQFDQATAAFREALKIKGDISALKALAQSLASQGKLSDAVSYLEKVLKRSPTAEIHLHLGIILAGTEERDKAIHHLNESVKGDLPVKSKALAHKQMGFIYYQMGRYSDAKSAFETALKLNPEDYSLYSAITETLMKLEDFEVAKEYLEKALALTETPLLLDQIAKIYRKEDRFQEAIDTLIKANAVEPKAERHYMLGLNYKDLGDTENAIIHLEKAAAIEPENNEFAVALGYAYKDTQKFKEAIRLFEAVIQRNPNYFGLYQELGYLHMHELNNEQAANWFKLAINNEIVNIGDSREEAKASRQKIYNLRKEVSKLNNRFDFTAYLTIRSDEIQNIPSTAQTGFASAVLPSDGGIELAYQPSPIGFLDERVFQVFLRLLGTTRPGTLAFNEDSFQGGMGIRYKPMKTHNLYLSLERLFRIGDGALDSWLLRALYSLDYGYDLKFDEQYWNYTFLFGDLGYFSEDPDIWAFYGEIRQGLTYNVRNSFLVTPHLIVDGRYQDPNNPGSSYIESGIGLSLKYLFNDTPYETHRSNLEALIYYKFGKFIEGDTKIIDDTFNGLVATLIFRY